MALSETQIIGEMNVAENGVISVRTDNVISKTEGETTVEVSRSFHRHVIVPTDDISGEDARVQAVANSLWTDEVVAAYQAAQAAAEPAAEESTEETE